MWRNIFWLMCLPACVFLTMEWEEANGQAVRGTQMGMWTMAGSPGSMPSYLAGHSAYPVPQGEKSADGKSRQRNPVEILTVSQLNSVLKDVHMQVALRAKPEIAEQYNLFDESYIAHLANHLDFNYIGTGKSVKLVKENLIEYILQRLEEGASLDAIGLDLVAEFEKSGFERSNASNSTFAFDIVRKDQPSADVKGVTFSPERLLQ